MYQRDDIEIKDAATLALAAYTAEREDVFVFNQYLPQIVSLNDIQNIWGLNPNTIKRERWAQKIINEGRKPPANQRFDQEGLGFVLDPIILNKKLYYYTRDVIDFIKSKQEQSPKKRLTKANVIGGGEYDA